MSSRIMRHVLWVVITFLGGVRVANADCYSLTYGGVNGNSSDTGIYVSWLSSLYRLNGNEVYSYSSTSLAGPNAPLVLARVTTAFYQNTSDIYDNSFNSTTYGASVHADTYHYLFLNGQYGLGTFRLGNPSGIQNTHTGSSPVCNSQGFYPLFNTFFDYSNTYTAVKPTIVGPGGAIMAAFWYLGGAASVDGYYVQSTLTGNAQTNVFSVMTWSTDTGTKLAISGSNPVGGISTATLTSRGYSHVGSYTPDIHATLSIDGLPSDPFPIFINTPYTMSTGSGTFGTCPDIGFPGPGYHNSVRHSVADLAGATLPSITTTESLENDHYLGTWNSVNSNWTTTQPPPSTWCPVGKAGCHAFWDNSTSFSDFFATCGPANQPLPSAYNPAGTNAVDNLTQKFWVGSPSGFAGECVQEGILTYYTDHGKLSGVITPVANQSQCALRSVIN